MNTTAAAWINILVATALAASCTNQPARDGNVQQPHPATDAGRSAAGSGNQNHQDDASGRGAGTHGVTHSIELKEETLKSEYNLDTSNLSYRFSYLEKFEEGILRFENGKATVTFRNLKHSTKGDVSLEIVEASAVKLRGIAKDVILNQGQQNKIELVLRAVDNQGSADLVVNISVDGSQPPVSNPTVPSDPPVVPVVPDPVVNDPPVSNPGGTNPPPTNPPTGPNGLLGYDRDIRPVMDVHCTECHHSGGKSPDLTRAPGAEVADKLIASIESGSMPPAPRDKVPASDLEKIKRWKNDGLKP